MKTKEEIEYAIKECRESAEWGATDDCPFHDITFGCCAECSFTTGLFWVLEKTI